MKSPEQQTAVEKAQRIHRLLQRNGVRERFRAQCQTFHDKYKAWERANATNEAALRPFDEKVYVIRHKEDECGRQMDKLVRKGQPKTSQEYKRLEAEKKRLTKQRRNAQGELKKAEASLQDPGPCPTDWLGVPRGYLPNPDRTMLNCFFPHDAGATQETERLRAYVLATILHDKALEGPEYQPIAEGVWSQDEEFVEGLVGVWWSKMTDTSGSDPECGWAVWCDQIETAIQTIEHDLETVGCLAAKKVKGQAAGKSSAEAKTKKQGLTPAEVRAWQSYCWVMETRPDLRPENGERDYTKDMYKAAMESPHYIDEGTGKRISKPEFRSWKRYLRGYVQKAPKTKDTRLSLRDEEIANEENIDDLSGIKGSLPTDQ
jgi:hypothetical protein